MARRLCACCQAAAPSYPAVHDPRKMPNMIDLSQVCVAVVLLLFSATALPAAAAKRCGGGAGCGTQEPGKRSELCKLAVSDLHQF